MEESDLFSSLSEADKAEGYRYDSLYIKPQPYNKGANPGTKRRIYVVREKGITTLRIYQY